MTKQIPLTRGKFATVDDEDYETLSKIKWQAVCKKGTNAWYAVHSVGKNGHCFKILMHRMILKAPRGLLVDHADHDGLNNTRSNIRLATARQNVQNARRRINKGVQYKGVSKTPDSKSWMATIRTDNTLHSLGKFPTPLLAALAYDAAARYYFGEFACTNFEGTDKANINTLRKRAWVLYKSNTASRWLGVSKSSPRCKRKWRARITVGMKLLTLGRFDSEIDAALAYNVAALKYHGVNARLNQIPA